MAKLNIISVQRPSMDHLQFNPNAFQVSKTAMKAKCSARVEELAHPMKR